MKKPVKKKVVVVGGGTGTYIALKGLKRYADTIELAAIVTMADSGGSTGRLRDEFGYLPVGDVRMALAALADESDGHQELLRQLFMYRFDRGTGLSGHTFGNLFLTALTEILGNEVAAIEAAGQLLRVNGLVYPVSRTPLHLTAVYDDGSIIEQEHLIDSPPDTYHAKRITKLSVNHTEINEDAVSALMAADLIMIGPGDLYTSILANVVVPGFTEAIAGTRARLGYVLNLMTRPGQTVGMSAEDHITAVEHYLTKPVDFVLYNTTPLPPDLLIHYHEVEGTGPVGIPNAQAKRETHGCDLLATESVVVAKGDTIKRSLIRHDPEKLANAILSFL